MKDWTGNKTSVYANLGASSHSDTERENIYQDSIFILCSLFDNPNHFKDFYTFTFISGLFDILNYIEDDLIFITNTPVSDDEMTAVENAVAEYGSNFRKVVHSDAGCTVSCHCGPGTLGVLFVRK